MTKLHIQITYTKEGKRMAHELEKALLACFEKGQYTEGTWHRQTDAVEQMQRQGFDRSQIRSLIKELIQDGCLEKFAAEEPVVRLTPEGWHRRADLDMYMDSIEFQKVDRNSVDPGKSVWWEVSVNGVAWGRFHTRYAENIETNLSEIRRSLCLSPRSNKEIVDTIRARFANIAHAT